MLSVLQKILERQKEHGRQLAELSKWGAGGGAAPAAGESALLEAMEARANKKLILDNGSVVSAAVAERI